MKDVLRAFDQYLHQKHLSFEATIIGGAALIVLGIVDRQTKDVDCLDPKIPQNIKAASVEFSKLYPELKLQEDWLNNGPDSLKSDLPKDWSMRVQEVFKGKALKITALGRSDFLKTKLFAYCDRQIDLSDCIAMRPSHAELAESLAWVLDRDVNELWPDHVLKSFKILANRCGYEFNP
jgi:hypothetical protein